MSKPRIWVDLVLHPQAQAMMRDLAEVIGGPPNQAAPADPFQGIEQADAAIVSSRLLWTMVVLQRGVHLQAVARHGIGYDNLDLEAMSRAGVCAINTPDGPTESTAEHTIALMLNVAKKVKAGDRMLAAGKSNFRSLTGIELLGKTLGLVGLGRIGSRVGQIAQGLGMHVIAYDPYLAPDKAAALGVRLVPSLPELLASAEVVSLHSPLSPATQKLIGAQELATMKAGAILINCARGALVDEAALYESLRQGHLAGAGLDVWDPEPPHPDNPLLALDTVVGTPHTASLTDDGLRKMSLMSCEQVMMVLNGHKPPHLLNPQVWEVRRK